MQVGGGGGGGGGLVGSLTRENVLYLCIAYIVMDSWKGRRKPHYKLFKLLPTTNDKKLIAFPPEFSLGFKL